MRKLIYITFLLLIGLESHSQYVLVWADEFSTPSLDPTKWAHEIGGNGWGNNEAQYYTNNSTNLSISGGELKITARAETFGSNQYTSAKISTKGLMEIKYGKIEARAKCPMGQGLWPAFWMLGANINTVSWPACGEIDVMEHINNEAKIYGTAHWNNVGHVYNGAPVNADPSQFHVYSIEWDSTKINWFIDGSIYHGINITNGVNGTNEFHEKFYAILNLAVGGNWPGYPNSSTVFPADFIIDYVRVYKDQSEASIEGIEIDNVLLYPNPTNDIINVLNVPNGKDCTIRIMNIDGKVISEKILDESENSVNISELEQGIYFADISVSNKQIKRIQFIKN